MDIGLMGRARAGKDTAGKILAEEHDYVRVAFADPLKEMALALNPIVTLDNKRLAEIVGEFGWDVAKHGCPEVRRVLQRLGLEAVRGVLGDDVWVDLAQSKIEAAWGRDANVVVTDVRFPNEVSRLRSLGFTLLWVDRPAMKSTTVGHASEHTVYPHHADAVITNDESVTDLHERLMETMNHLWDERSRE